MFKILEAFYFYTIIKVQLVPDELKPYVNDYRMNLFEIAYLSDKQVQMFQSDFRIVADYFVQMRKNQNYVAPATTIQHVHELLQLMSVMTKDYRFEEVYHPNMERKDTNMCEVLDRIENRGIEKGTVIGFKKGTKQGEDTAFSLVRLLMESNRLDDLKKATEDSCYREKLIQELFPQNQTPI